MFDLQEIGRLPAPEDNCAIAVRTLAAGTAVAAGDPRFILRHTILEGHRFAVRSIPKGSPLFSWGKTFGRALRDIAPGDYVCNAGVLDELNSRSLDFLLPARPNFSDDLETYRFDAAHFLPAPPLLRIASAQTFSGIRRPGNRGVGTRNMILLLGMNAHVNGFLQQLEKELRTLAERYEHVDGIVAVAHTEGSRVGSNNEAHLLRTLAGFLLHPNAAAVLVLDTGVGLLGHSLIRYTENNGYPLETVLHQFLSLDGPFAEDLARCAAIVQSWLPQVNAMHRSPQPLSELKIALQCGGSDAFSGISGNPLAALVSKWVIQAGGSAMLAETDELIGAESYVLDRVRDAATAERFLQVVARFQEQAAWHGHSAHGNPSGGNKYRGLYNIYLKSLGAAAKRHPDVRLDGVLEYGERMNAPGFYFMDSPGNDLESIAGQVASGCNLIFFVTGNGSITNFPFVPTIKIVTTSQRYALLAGEMDVNAGAYLDGRPLAELAEEMLDLSRAVASGLPSAGEKAGHAQVQIWRDWPLSGHLEQEPTAARPSGRPLPVQKPRQTAGFVWQGYKVAGLQHGKVVNDRVGLILPASLCSGQVARMAAERLNQSGLGIAHGISRFAALVHTEGCGSSIEPELVSTFLGYLAHPMAASLLVLEHGCEISHNDFWHRKVQEAGQDPLEVGWASVQQDGGIERVLHKIAAWFKADLQRLPEPFPAAAGFRDLSLGLMAQGEVDAESGAALFALVQQIAAGGGAVILADNDPLAAHPAFSLNGEDPTLAFAQQPAQPGLHLMANASSSWSETMTGLGAAGVEAIIAVCTTRGQQGHPFIPILQVASAGLPAHPFHADMDLLLAGDPKQRLEQLLAQLSAVLSRTMAPKLTQQNNVTFQITRGQLGVSL
jgi:altronate dehydratase